jgi:adenylate cyclase
MVRARLSRRIAFWIFLNFLVVEGVVLVPSVLRQAERLGEQLREVTNAKLEWLVANGQAGSAEDLLDAVRDLQAPAMVKAIEGAALYRESTGELLGRFGAMPQLSAAVAGRDGAAGRWYRLSGAYDAAWGGDNLPGDHLLVIRHDAGSIREGLRRYILNIALIVLGIAAFLTVITMLVIHHLVVGRILTLRDRLVLAGAAFADGRAGEPERYLLQPGQPDEVGQLEEAFNHSFLRTSAEMERRLAAERSAQVERDRAERLLLTILPASIAEQMKQGRQTIAETHADVSVLFADIVGFTELSARLPCHAVVNLLNQVFTAFDQLCEQHGLEKIKTIGDNYMVVGGVPAPCEHHADAIAAMALDMQRWIRRLRVPEVGRLDLRIGIHSGPVVAGVIGSTKFAYDIWGETVNIASRLECHGLPGRIQVSGVLAGRLEPRFRLEKRGPVALRGVGAMTTYWLTDSPG